MCEERITELDALVDSEKKEIKQAEDAFKEILEYSKELNAEQLTLQKQIKQLLESCKDLDANIKDLQHRKANIDKQVCHSTS